MQSIDKVMWTILAFSLAIFVYCAILASPKNDAFLKEACLQDGGTAVEQPAGTFIKCLR